MANTFTELDEIPSDMLMPMEDDGIAVVRVSALMVRVIAENNDMLERIKALLAQQTMLAARLRESVKRLAEANKAREEATAKYVQLKRELHGMAGWA